MNRAQWSRKTRQFGLNDGNNEKRIVMLLESNLRESEKDSERELGRVRLGLGGWKEQDEAKDAWKRKE